MSAPHLRTTATATTAGANAHPSFATLHALHTLLGTSLAALQQSYTTALSLNLVPKPSADPNEEGHNEDGLRLGLPSLSSPYNPGASEDHLARDPDARRAVLRIVAACEQMVACVRTPMETLSDAAMFFQLPACLAVLENAHIVEILRDAGVAGMHVNDIAAQVPVCVDGKDGTIDSMVLARILRCLATNHLLTEVSPDVFATNRISSFMDTGKSADDILRDPCAKYDGTNGVAAYVGMTTYEVFRSSAYLSESLGLGPRTSASPPPSPISSSQARSTTVRRSALRNFPDTATTTAATPGGNSLHTEQHQGPTCIHPDRPSPSPGWIAISNLFSSDATSAIASGRPEESSSNAFATHAMSNINGISNATNLIAISEPNAEIDKAGASSVVLVRDAAPDRGSDNGFAVSNLIGVTTKSNTQNRTQTQTRTIVTSPVVPPSALSSISTSSSPYALNSSRIQVPAQEQEQQIYTWKPHVHSRSVRPSSKVKLGSKGATFGNVIHNISGTTRTMTADGRNGGMGEGGLTPKTATRTTRSLPSPLLPPVDSLGVVPSNGDAIRDRESAARMGQADASTGDASDTHADVPWTAFSLAFRTRLPFFAFLEAQGGAGVDQLPSKADDAAAERAGESVTAPSGATCIPGIHENANAGEDANDNFLVRRFGAAMRGTSQAGWEMGGVVGGFDWASLGTSALVSSNGNGNALVIDVGGGIGSACLALAEAYPHLRFVVQDRGPVVRVAREVWEEAKPEWVREGRVAFEEHDFFLPQPPRASGPPAAYILRAIAHDWPDKQVLRILRRLRECAGMGTALVLGDHVIPYACVGGKSGESEGSAETLPGAFSRLTEEGVEDVLLPNLGRGCINAYWMDITMHEVFESQERTITHIVALAREAGWRAVRVNRIESSLFAYVICYPDSSS